MFESLNCRVEKDFSMKRLNTWKVGGNCKYYVIPNDIQDVLKVKKICKQQGISLLVLGNGSNILVDDEGYPGVVLHVGKGLKNIVVEKDYVMAEAGVMMPMLAFSMSKKSISGFEFYAGIPGTVGGGVVMNAGCLGKDTKSILKSVTYIDENGEILEKSIDELNMKFRKSEFLYSNKVILHAKYNYNVSLNQELVEMQTKKAADIRKGKFPTNVATAGSTFKSPPGGPYPGKLIEDIGLKGYRIGGAVISDIHGNWIINTGEATSDEIKELINFMKSSVKEQTGVELETEVIFV